MKTRLFITLVLLLSLLPAVSGGAAAQGDRSSATAPAVEPLSKTYLPLILRQWPTARVGMVSDIAGVNDNSFNSLAWKGVTNAQAALGVAGKLLESASQSDYASNIQQLLNEKQDLIVTVGFTMAVATANAAKVNPARKFAIVDYTFPDCWPGAVEGLDCGSTIALPNVRGLMFQSDQAGFLAGYLAAGMTGTGKVGTFGGMQIPTVTIFMTGYQAGVKYYNQQHATSVELLGWDESSQTGWFNGNFTSFADGVTYATNLVTAGADIIMPVAGPVGLGSASYCKISGNCLIIGVDTDWFVTAPEYASVELSSVIKNVDVAVYQTIQDVVNGTFSGGMRTYDLADNGVDLAPFHNFGSVVPQALKNEIAQAKADLISGAITIDGVLFENYGLVTDIGGVHDNSFNSLAWKGFTEAFADLGVTGGYLEPHQQSDYARHIQRLLNVDEDLIVTVGFTMGVATANAAKANPGRKFAIVDYTFPDCWTGAVEGTNCGSFTALPNVRGLMFQSDQAGFLAGYLAAGMTETGKVGTYGGMQIPTVTIFMKGYQAGVKYYNQQHATSVQLLGWNNATQTGLFTGDFDSFEAGVTFATNLVTAGADIIMPIAGPTSLGSASYCQSSGNCLIIGVDTDWFVTAPDYAGVFLSSVLKNIDVAVYLTIQDVVNGTFSAGTVFYDLGDNGVGLAPFHNFNSVVPQALKNEIAQAKADLISGAITVDGVLNE